MMRGLALPMLMLLAACDPPPLVINYRVAGDVCPASTCDGVPLACKAFINVRIVRPSNPRTPVASFCQEIGNTNRKDLCTIANNKFDEMNVAQVPSDTLQVQVSIWPESAISYPMEGPDGILGTADDEADQANPICPGAKVNYDVGRGFPVVGQAAMPAIGGSTYIPAGASEATVVLGCVNLPEVNTCENPLVVPVLATVEDFDTRVSVESGAQAKHLTVSVGEPSLIDPAENRYQLIPKALELDTTLAVPSWSGELDAPLNTYACVNVLDDVAQTTGAVTCERAPKTKPYLLHGTRLLKDPAPGGVGLSTILAALGPLPGDGLTIGIVVDYRSNPVEHAIVKGHDPGSETPAQGDIKYLSADRSTFTGTETSTSGIFVVTNAIFGTLFQTSNPSPAASTDTVEKIGGGIDGRVTIVVLQLPPPPLGRK